MDSVIGTILPQITKSLAEGNDLICFFLIGKIMKKVDSEKRMMISNGNLVQEKIEATSNTERVNDAVFEWQKEMEKLIEDVENLNTRVEQDIMPHNCLLAGGSRLFDTNNAKRYKMYREMLKKIKVLNTNCDFDPFSSPIPGLDFFSSGNFVSFETMKEASDRLLQALQDDHCYIIGLYGKRGSGKTKLVKVLSEIARYLNTFHKVLFITVSPNPNIRRIQDDIADSLNLKFDRNTEAGRARKIYLTLENLNRPVLVILDDVHKKVELEDNIGIPCNSNRCKILLTTRYQRECAMMDCQREIPLGPISIEEAWTFLKNHSGIDGGDDESSFDLLNIARDVANECEGLPGKIKEVGSSLKGKPIEEWKASLDSLRHSMACYHVFLSFRGEDTRHSFTGFLYQALCQKGFKTFMDDGGLHTGDQISPSLINAIEASRLSIVVLSKNYARSSWCLDELVKILECMKTKNQLVWPIFYKVDPSDIRHLRKSYGKAMAEHEKRFAYMQRVHKWRSALFDVSGLSGKAYKSGYEYEFIQQIVEDANNIKNRLYIRSMDMD